MKMIINGKKTDSASGQTFDVIAPATGKVIDSVPRANEKDLDAALAAAVRGQKEWAKVPIFKRAEVLYKLLSLVQKSHEDLARLLSSENGKPIT